MRWAVPEYVDFLRVEFHPTCYHVDHEYWTYYLHDPLSMAAKASVEELRQDGGIGAVIALDQ